MCNKAKLDKNQSGRIWGARKSMSIASSAPIVTVFCTKAGKMESQSHRVNASHQDK